jgi:hypothetical protein
VDLSRDGRVDGADLALFGTHWLAKDCPIVINEVLAHAHAEASDWIELYNAGSVPVNVGGWFLSDSKNDLTRYQIAAGTTIEPRYLSQRPFGRTLRSACVVCIHGNGDTVYLFDNTDLPGYVIGNLRFTAGTCSAAIGRAGNADFVTMSEPTPGAANAYPRGGPVVIEEIMYHPATDADADYVELLNISGEAVTLFDFLALLPWRLTDDTGVSVRLPADPPVTLQPGEPLLLIRDAAAMRPYNVPAGVQTIPWGSGRLDNAGGRLRCSNRATWTSPERSIDRGDTVSYSDGSHERRFL